MSCLAPDTPWHNACDYLIRSRCICSETGLGPTSNKCNAELVKRDLLEVPMKITKQARAALFVMLLAISILPGCGKNKNQGEVGIGVAPIGLFPGAPAGSTSFAFYGNGQVGAGGGLYGNFSAGGSGQILGQQYVRNNSSGDRILVSVSGSAGSQVTVSGIVSLAPSTVAWYQVNCGGMPNMVIFQGQVLPATGTILSSIPVGLGYSCGLSL